MKLPIQDRTAAGQALAKVLQPFREQENLLVIALPRGGVPVAYELARSLHVSMDLMLVRKLVTHEQSELAIGAIASGGILMINDDLVSHFNLSEDTMKQIIEREDRELERREKVYRGNRPFPEIAGRSVILVDDGVATGATIRAAIIALRKLRPDRIIIAVPVAPADIVKTLRSVADDVICLASPEPFIAVGKWYVNFEQVTDDQVKQLMDEVWFDEK